MDAGVMAELGIIQPGDRVYAENHPYIAGLPWGWGVVTPPCHTQEIYDGCHIFAVWEFDAFRRVVGIRAERITRWEISPERLEAAELRGRA